MPSNPTLERFERLWLAVTSNIKKRWLTSSLSKRSTYDKSISTLKSGFFSSDHAAREQKRRIFVTRTEFNDELCRVHQNLHNLQQQLAEMRSLQNLVNFVEPDSESKDFADPVLPSTTQLDNRQENYSAKMKNMHPKEAAEIAKLKKRLIDAEVVPSDCFIEEEIVPKNLCEFVTDFVEKSLNRKQSSSYYHSIDEIIQHVSDEKISLIIPAKGEKISREKHCVVGEYQATKGHLNVVHALVLPGVYCYGKVERPADIVKVV